ncbi:SUMF1/EgtB/PvdO family nonheme iron enzyme [bacterium]|nr:SUMF1/EgtB/PvdO family nonheme iron enzyme [bacterium]
MARNKPSGFADSISVLHPREGQTIRGTNVEVVGWVAGAPHEAGSARMVFRVNGKFYSSLDVLAHGRTPFKTHIPLKAGPNEIQLELLIGARLVDRKALAVNAQGQGEEITYGSLYKNSWAILIGIDNCPAAQPLKYAVKDARAIREFLVNETHFDEDRIFMLLNEEATKRGILELMNDFLGANPALTPDDRVLVFFAGHGQRRKIRKGRRKSDYRGYLIPFDGNLEKLHSSCISMEEINEAASVICAKHTLFVLDCCFSGMAGLRPRACIIPRPLDKALADPCVRIITAGKSDEEVFEGRTSWGGNSLFTKYFLKGLQGFADKDGDNIITSDDVYQFVRERVTHESRNRQTPQARHLSEYGEGQFVFFVKQQQGSLGKIEDYMGAKAVAQEQWAAAREPVDAASIPTENGIGEFARIASAHFIMGSKESMDETPHIVSLDSFEIDVTPITNGQYKHFLEATAYDGRAEADENYLRDWLSGTFPAGEENYPITWVSWFNAVAFCKWRGFRLPTEAEWEMACRGGLRDKVYPFGDHLPDEFAKGLNTRKRKMSVKITPPNGFGLFDLIGSVSQWCSDYYGKTYYQQCPEHNPKGPDNRQFRVVRGGSFLAGPRLLRCAARLFSDPGSTSKTIGFRCAR